MKERSDDGGGELNIICKDDHCSSSGTTMKRRLSKVAKKSHHWLPSIHEDYYGPRGHRPRHHLVTSVVLIKALQTL